MQVGKITTVVTVAANQFRAGLAQNAGEDLSLQVQSAAVGLRVDSIIRNISIVSVEDRNWELWFWGRNTFNEPTPDIDTFIGSWLFAVAGKQIGAAGLFHYYVDGLYIPYRDLDQTSKIHMTLVNRSAGAKSAGDAGAIRVQLGLEMALGV